MLSEDPDHFFQSDKDLILQQKREAKKTSIGSTAGDPKEQPSKVISIVFPVLDGSSVFTAESGFVARKVDISVLLSL